MVISIDETTKRAIAVEGAIFVLTMGLLNQKSLNASAALDVLNMLSQSSESSASKLSNVISDLEKLVSLGDK